MIAQKAGKEIVRAQERRLSYRFGADRGAPARVRDALAADLGGIDPGPSLTVGLLARALVAKCIRCDGGTVRVEVVIGAEQVRVEVSGEGAGFKLPVSSRSIDYFSFDDETAPPPGWRTYLIERLADGWGVDERRGVAWLEVDHATDTARRLRSATVPAD